MTEAATAPGTSEILNAPMEPETARQLIKERIADRDFGKRLLDKDPAATAEWTGLHKAGYPAAPQITSIEYVNSQAAARNAEMWNGYIGALKQRFPLSAEQEAELRGGVIRADVRAWASEEKDQLIKDRGFRTKLLDGDSAANLKWGLVVSMLSLRPVKP